MGEFYGYTTILYFFLWKLYLTNVKKHCRRPPLYRKAPSYPRSNRTPRPEASRRTRPNAFPRRCVPGFRHRAASGSARTPSEARAARGWCLLVGSLLREFGWTQPARVRVLRTTKTFYQYPIVARRAFVQGASKFWCASVRSSVRPSSRSVWTTFWTSKSAILLWRKHLGV